MLSCSRNQRSSVTFGAVSPLMLMDATWMCGRTGEEWPRKVRKCGPRAWVVVVKLYGDREGWWSHLLFF